jgi:HAD superfamily hydrolase (TIGR01450 family)
MIGDIHHGPAVETKDGGAALCLLGNFIKESNSLSSDMVVDLGDRISDVDRDTDFRSEQEVGRVFSESNAPVRFILGNHDVVNLTAADNEDALGASMAHGSADIGGFHLVFWNAHSYIPSPKPTRGALPSDLEWLRNNLNSSDLPSVIFTHFPLVEASMAGNYYFESALEYSFDPNATLLREYLSQWGRVVLCVSGHVHWNSLHLVDDIPFFSIDSLTETFHSSSRASEGWGTLTLGEEISIQTRGIYPMNVVLPLRAPGVRWTRGISVRERAHRLRDELQARREASESMPVMAVLLDLDGVVWRGDELIRGSDLFVNKMRQAGIKVVAVTNCAGKTREEYAAKLARFGLEFGRDDIITSGYAAARLLAKISPLSTVVIIGGDAIRSEFKSLGIREGRSPDYLILSADDSVTLGDLSDSIRWLERGVRLVATNPDAALPTDSGARADCGAALAFLTACCGTAPIIIGKPEPAMFEMAVSRTGVPIENTVMIGDTLKTDIDGAGRLGMRSILVRTGNANQADQKDCGESSLPWMTFERLNDASGLILGLNGNLKSMA